MTARVRCWRAKTTIAATYTSTGVVLLALALLVAFLLQPPLLGWVGFAVACAIVLSLVTVATIAFPRMRINPQRPAVALDHQSRLLVVADEHCGSPALWQEIYARLDDAVAVHLVVPVRVSHLHYVTNDEREESRDAEDRARLAIELLRQRGVSVTGGVGSDDPLESMTDALASFPATRVLLATSTEEDSYWMEQGLVARARALTPLQVDHVVVPPTPTHRPRSEARTTMTRVSAKPASEPRRRREQGQPRARQSGCPSESGSPGVHRLPLDLAPAEVMFDGLKILTAPGLVMTPVPTTEALVQWAAEWIGSRSVRVADVGTGSGAVAVALAFRAPAAWIWATDDSEPAVALARANVARHGLDERVQVLLGDLLNPVPGELDLVVANLPYHAEARARGPAESAYSDQPAHAIYAPGDGLGYYRELLEACRSRLNGGGALAIQLYGSVLAAGRGQLDELAREIEIRAHAGWESRVAAGSGERKPRWSAFETKRVAA